MQVAGKGGDLGADPCKLLLALFQGLVARRLQMRQEMMAEEIADAAEPDQDPRTGVDLARIGGHDARKHRFRNKHPNRLIGIDRFGAGFTDRKKYLGHG